MYDTFMAIILFPLYIDYTFLPDACGDAHQDSPDYPRTQSHRTVDPG